MSDMSTNDRNDHNQETTMSYEDTQRTVITCSNGDRLHVYFVTDGICVDYAGGTVLIEIDHDSYHRLLETTSPFSDAPTTIAKIPGLQR